MEKRKPVKPKKDSKDAESLRSSKKTGSPAKTATKRAKKKRKMISASTLAEKLGVDIVECHRLIKVNKLRTDGEADNLMVDAEDVEMFLRMLML
ncbi:MAG TPA: hypothetical protein VIM99_05350 [Blastocatellia bacterium]